MPKGFIVKKIIPKNELYRHVGQTVITKDARLVKLLKVQTIETVNYILLDNPNIILEGSKNIEFYEVGAQIGRNFIPIRQSEIQRALKFIDSKSLLTLFIDESSIILGPKIVLDRRRAIKVQ